MMLPGLFVTGTDTNVGKSWFTAAIADCLRQIGHRPGVIKPVATGLTDIFEEETDAVTLLRHGGWAVDEKMLRLACPLTFEAAAAPTVAARAEGRRLEWPEVLAGVKASLAGWAEAGADLILVEGVGGLECPLAEGGKTVADLLELLDFPALVVARRGLGTLSHTISAVKRLQRVTARVAGVVLNQVPADSPDGIPESTAAIELSGRIAPVGVLHDGKAAKNPAELAGQIEHLGWQTRLGLPRW